MKKGQKKYNSKQNTILEEGEEEEEEEEGNKISTQNLSVVGFLASSLTCTIYQSLFRKTFSIIN